MAGYQDLFMNQGETFTSSLTLTDDNGLPYDLSNFIIASQARKSFYSANAVITFDSAITDHVGGVIQISANSATTLNVSATRLVYDVYIREVPTGTVSRVLEGTIYVSPAVTTTLSY
jgi:hypothetical protein